ncbi:MAG: LUD domain-containing protein [Thermoanaerobaculia bacterium]
MEREKLEKSLKDAGIKFFWVEKEELFQKIKDVVDEKRVFVSPTLKIDLGTYSPVQEAEVGIFEAMALCESTGTMLVEGEELASLVPPISLAILMEKNIRKDLSDIIDIIKENPEKPFAFITGPSRTADIEKQVVIPAHGPKELILLIVKI